MSCHRTLERSTPQLAGPSLQYDRTMIVMDTDKMYSVPEQPHDNIHDRLRLLGDPTVASIAASWRTRGTTS